MLVLLELRIVVTSSQAKDGEVFESRGGKDLKSLFITNFFFNFLIQVIIIYNLNRGF